MFAVTLAQRCFAQSNSENKLGICQKGLLITEIATATIIGAASAAIVFGLNLPIPLESLGIFGAVFAEKAVYVLGAASAIALLDIGLIFSDLFCCSGDKKESVVPKQKESDKETEGSDGINETRPQSEEDLDNQPIQPRSRPQSQKLDPNSRRDIPVPPPIPESTNDRTSTEVETKPETKPIPKGPALPSFLQAVADSDDIDSSLRVCLNGIEAGTRESKALFELSLSEAAKANLAIVLKNTRNKGTYTSASKLLNEYLGKDLNCYQRLRKTSNKELVRRTGRFQKRMGNLKVLGEIQSYCRTLSRFFDYSPMGITPENRYSIMRLSVENVLSILRIKKKDLVPEDEREYSSSDSDDSDVEFTGPTHEQIEQRRAKEAKELLEKQLEEIRQSSRIYSSTSDEKVWTLEELQKALNAALDTSKLKEDQATPMSRLNVIISTHPTLNNSFSNIQSALSDLAAVINAKQDLNAKSVISDNEVDIFDLDSSSIRDFLSELKRIMSVNKAHKNLYQQIFGN